MRTNWRSVAFVVALATTSSTSFGQSQPRPKVKELIAVIERAAATQHDKARACQQLGEFGTKAAVPALAALLSDPALSAYARSGLEGIPDPAAAAALRAALGTLSGELLIGVVNSLGVLRDGKAVRALSRLAGDSGSGAAPAALLALGRVSNSEAIGVLRRALATAPKPLRAEASVACLIAAEVQYGEGDARAAAALYDAVRAADVPLPYRIAATRGAILAKKSEGLGLLVKLLRSDDWETRNIALYTIHELSGAAVAAALRAELETAKPEVQPQLVAALAECGRDPQSLRLIRTKAAAAVPEVREAAFEALGKIGDPADAAVLLNAVVSHRSPAESVAAANSLARIEGAEVESMILKSLASVEDPGARVALIDLLDARPPSRAAMSELLKEATDPDLPVSLAALRAMRSVARLTDLPALIKLTRTYEDGSRRAAAESAMYYASTRASDSTQAGELLLVELKQTGDDLQKASCMRILSRLGYDKALPTVAASLRSKNAWLVTTAIESLREWPNPAPVDELLGLAQSTSDTGTHTRALTAGIGLAAAAAETRQAPDEAVVSWFHRAGQAARSAQDKRLIVSGLGRLRSAATFRLLGSYLEDAEVKTDASSAIVNVAQTLAEGSDYAIVKPVLEKISPTADRTLPDRIESLKRTIAARESAARQGR